MGSMGRPRCRRRIAHASHDRVEGEAAPKPPSRRSSPFFKSAFLGFSAVLVVSSKSAEAFVTSSVRGLEPNRHRAGRLPERSERGASSVVMFSERRGLWPGRVTIDLRSDTVTQPTGGMRKAMQKVGPQLLTCGFLKVRLGGAGACV